MSEFKVLYTDTIYADTEIEESTVKEAGGEFILGSSLSASEFENVLKEVDGIVNTYMNIDKEFLQKAEKSKVIVRMGIGFNNIDIAAAGEAGKYACNVPDYCFDEVSDHAMILALTLGRKVLQFDKRVKSGIWDHDGMAPIYPFRGATFGLLAFGNIAKQIVAKAQAFGFNVIAYDPFVTKEVARKYGVELVSFEELLTNSDVLSVHSPLTDETKHIINYENLSKMKKRAVIINTSRGPLVDENGLYKALSEGLIAGAGLDVMEIEPPEKDNPLYNLDNVIITPHTAFYSEKSAAELRRKAFEEAIRVIKGEQPKNCVNRKYLK
jgi:D-3-phosphoglycerate dehydrogenase / 2-oxoglutarate reductase